MCHDTSTIVMWSASLVNWRLCWAKTKLNTILSLQPRSQRLSSNCPLRRARRDLGLVWSHATLTIENTREGSSVIRQFVALSFVVLRPPLTAMFNNSLRAEILNSIYSGIYLKVRQVCLETICRGRDVVAVVPIGFMESRSYFNCGRRAAQFYSEVIVILALLFLLWMHAIRLIQKKTIKRPLEKRTAFSK